MTAPVTVLISSRERPDMLLDTVRSVLAGSTVPAELLVVDQSARPHAELARMDADEASPVRYLHSATAGLSRARNVGLRSARHDVVVQIDDDMLVEGDWLETLVGALEGEGEVVLTGRVLPAPPESPGARVPPAALVTSERPDRWRGRQRSDPVPGANLVLPRRLVLSLGGYDERLGAGTRFSAADDNDMGHRLLLAGCEVRHVPAAVTYHRAWRSRGQLLRLRWNYGRGKGAFYAKHVLAGDRPMAARAARDTAARVRRAANAVRTPRRAVAELVSVAGVLAGALEWLVRERRAPWPPP